MEARATRNRRYQEDRFVGFDEASKGYRIYWPEKRSVSVERDVIFEDSPLTEVMIPDVPSDDEDERAGPSSTEDKETGKEEPANATPNQSAVPEPTENKNSPVPVPEHTPKATKPPAEPAERRTSSRLRKPSAYVKDLVSGENSTTGLPQAPKGICADAQAVTGAEVLAASVEPGYRKSEVEEMAREVEIAMATSTEVFGELRTLKEAERRKEWAKWKEAVER